MNLWMQIIISTLIAAGAGIWSGYSWIQLANRNNVSKGKISGKIIDEDKPFTLNFGSNFVTFDGSVLKKGINLRELSKINVNGVNVPIKIYHENGRLMIDATVFDKDGNVVCQIIGNDWEVNNNSYQRNYSVNAFEIVDNEMQPILQILLKENNMIIFGGYFFTKTGKKVHYSSDGIFTGYHKMTTLFKYPSSKYLGRFQDAQ